jgi:tetratricopeptide (TPR) repeat protein
MLNERGYRMKISLAFIRKEADLYRSQGLHKEAYELYAKFLARSPKMDPGSKSTIEKQARLIKMEMNCGDSVASQELSADQIDLIKKDWGVSASESDLLMCAQAFMEIGRYVEALKEFRKMIIKGSAFEPLSSPITDCFLQLFDSQELPSKVERYAKALYRDESSILMFQVSIAEELLNHGRLDHALTFYHYLSKTTSNSENLQPRIIALGTKMNALSAQQAEKPHPLEDQVYASQHKSSPVQIGLGFKSFVLKMITMLKAH